MHVRWTALCSKKIWRCILIKNHRNNLLFSYYKLCCLELSSFWHCFDLKYLKPEQAFRTLEEGLDLTKNVLNVYCLRFEIRQQRLQKIASTFKKEQIYTENRFSDFQKLVLGSAKTSFENFKNRFWDRQKPILGSAKTGFRIRKNRFWDFQKPVLKFWKIGYGI